MQNYLSENFSEYITNGNSKTNPTIPCFYYLFWCPLRYKDMTNQRNKQKFSVPFIRFECLCFSQNPIWTSLCHYHTIQTDRCLWAFGGDSFIPRALWRIWDGEHCALASVRLPDSGESVWEQQLGVHLLGPVKISFAFVNWWTEKNKKYLKSLDWYYILPVLWMLIVIHTNQIIKLQECKVDPLSFSKTVPLKTVILFRSSVVANGNRKNALECHNNPPLNP